MINLEHANTLKEIADQMHSANAELSVLHKENDRLAKALSHNLATLVNKERQAKQQDDANKWQADRIGRLDALVNEKEAALARALERIALLEKNSAMPTLREMNYRADNERLQKLVNDASGDAGMWRGVAGETQKKLEAAEKMIDDLRGAWKTVHDDYMRVKAEQEKQLEVERAERKTAAARIDDLCAKLAAYEGLKTSEQRESQADARAEAWRAISVESDTKARAFEQDNNRLRAEIQTIISAVRTAIYGQGKPV